MVDSQARVSKRALALSHDTLLPQTKRQPRRFDLIGGACTVVSSWAAFLD